MKTKRNPTFAEHLCDAIWRINRFVSSELQTPEIGDGVTLAQLRILRGLAEDGPLSMSRIAVLVGVSKATTTPMVDRLVARKLVERLVDPLNRRVILVRLTPKGRKFFVKSHDKFVRRTHLLARNLLARDKAEFRRLLEVITANIPQQEPANNGERRAATWPVPRKRSTGSTSSASAKPRAVRTKRLQPFGIHQVVNGAEPVHLRASVEGVMNAARAKP